MTDITGSLSLLLLFVAAAVYLTFKHTLNVPRGCPHTPSPFTAAVPPHPCWLCAESGARVMERTVVLDDAHVRRTAEQSIDDFFEVGRTAAAIVGRGCHRIALQLPDDLLPDAPALVGALRAAVPAEYDVALFVLGDTSYGTCCVDEVAAQHADADLVVHYGRSCLSPTSRLPVVYVFGRGAVDVTHAMDSLKAPLEAAVASAADGGDCGGDAANRPIVVAYDNVYQHAVPELQRQLRAAFPGTAVVTPAVVLEGAPAGSTAAAPEARCCARAEDGAGGGAGASSCGCAPAAATPTSPTPTAKAATSPPPSTTPSVNLGGQSVELPDGVAIEDCAVVYLGGEGPRLTNILMRCPSAPCVSYNPVTRAARREGATVNKSLAQRFRLVQHAKAASVVGIVVGTLGVARYRDVLASVRHLVRDAGLQSYSFVVGKLNVAKLANFAEIDVFVLVACPESSVIDSREFYKPVITPFELAVALNPDVEWTGTHTSDFAEVLPQLGGIVDDGCSGDAAAAAAAEGDDVGSGSGSGSNGDSDSDSDAPVFSAVTGTYVSRTRRKDTRRRDVDASAGAGAGGPAGGSTALVVPGESQLALQPQTAAGAFLASRSYQGLDPQYGETPAADVTPGLMGIAASYVTMPTAEVVIEPAVASDAAFCAEACIAAERAHLGIGAWDVLLKGFEDAIPRIGAFSFWSCFCCLCSVPLCVCTCVLTFRGPMWSSDRHH